MVGKKRRPGLQAPKSQAPKTREEIERAYHEHAALLGHKMRIISELEDEVLNHRESLSRLNSEAMALPRPLAPAAQPQAPGGAA